MLVFLAASAALLSGCSSINNALRPERIQATIAEGDRQEDLGNMKDARRFYDSAIQLAPDSTMPYVGDNSDPDNPNFGLAYSLTARSDWTLLNEYLSKAVKNPDLAASWQINYYLAQAQERLGLAAEAKASYIHAFDNMKGHITYKGEIIGGGVAASTVDRANIEWGAGMTVQARRDFLDIISRDPSSSDAIEAENDLAYNEAEQNSNLPEAYALSKKAVDALRDEGVNGDDLANFVDTQAWVEYKMGKYDDATRDYAEAVNDSPRQPILHLHLAEVDKAMGDTVGAKIEIDRAFVLCPEDYQIVAAAKQIDPNALSSPQA